MVLSLLLAGFLKFLEAVAPPRRLGSDAVHQNNSQLLAAAKSSWNFGTAGPGHR